MNELFIAPSVLSADFTKMGEDVERIAKGGADMIHCDVMDGLFVPNISFGPKMVADIRKHTDLPLDVHLMIVQPERYLETFAKAGADYITVHVEATEKARYCLERIRELGRKKRHRDKPRYRTRTSFRASGHCGHGAGYERLPRLRRTKIYSVRTR